MKIVLKKSKLKIYLNKLMRFFTRIGSYASAQIFVLCIVLVLINVFSQEYFFRIDFTKAKIYTLSEGTKNILNSLDDQVVIKTFFSDNIPPDLLQVKQGVEDTYKEYVRFGNGQVSFESQNPSDEDFKNNARTAGIPEIRYQEYSEDKYEIAQGFLGVAISYKGETEVIELVSTENIQNLEYETTSRIYKLVNTEKLNVGFLTGHGEKSIYTDYSSVKKQLEVEFAIEEINLSDGEGINSSEVQILIIAAPTIALSERDMFEIDQYIMHGGKVIFLVDQYQLDYQSPIMAKSEDNLAEFLKNYGVEMTDSMLLDESFLPLQYMFTYPYWVLVQQENILQDNPAFSQLQSLVFFWANPVKEIETEADRRFTSLIQTTEKAWEKTGESFSVDPAEPFVPGDQQQFTIAALVEGSQTSAFKGKEIPVLDSVQEDIGSEPKDRIDAIEDSQIIVIGDGDFISDDFIDLSEQSSIFFLNLVEWLANSEDLMSIRSKGIQTRPLKVIPSSQKAFVKMVNIASVPIVLIALGVVYNIVRKKRKSRI